MTTDAPPRRSRRLLILLGVGLAVVALAVAGLVVVRAVTRPPEVEPLTGDFCATVTDVLPPDAVPSGRKVRHGISPVKDGEQGGECTLASQSPTGTFLEVYLTRQVGRLDGAVERSRKEFRDRAGTGGAWKPIPGLGDEASGVTISAPTLPGVATILLWARDGADMLHVRYTARPATESDVRAVALEITRRLLRAL